MAEKMADAQFTIAITEWLLEEIRRDYPNLRQDQAILGRIGVDTKKWTPEQKAVKGELEVFQIITVGRLHSSKGHDLLIRAIKTLVDAGRNVKLTVIGAGPERQYLESLVGELGLSNLVEFAGSVSEDRIIEYMKQSDIFVLASHAEPLGVVYMEAMAMEVPTIGTNAGGVPEIITDGRDGLLVSPGDEQSLAQAISRLMENSDLRAQLARCGRGTVAERFDSRIGAATLHQKLFGTLPKDSQHLN